MCALDPMHQRFSGMAIRKLDISSLGTEGPHLSGRIVGVNLLNHLSQSPSRASICLVSLVYILSIEEEVILQL